MKELAQALPDAIFILTLRHYSGIVQSLERSYQDGYLWAGANWTERAKLFCRFYDEAPFLPVSRVIPISYDRLCADPKGTITSFKAHLADFGIDTLELNDDQFAQSHASNRMDQHPTIASQADDGRISFMSIPSFNPQQWNRTIAEEILPIVKSTGNLLRNLFPKTYTDPMGFPSWD